MLPCRHPHIRGHFGVAPNVRARPDRPLSLPSPLPSFEPLHPPLNYLGWGIEGPHISPPGIPGTPPLSIPLLALPSAKNPVYLESHFTPTPPRRNVPQPSPRRESPPGRKKSPRRTQSESHNCDPRKVGQNGKDSLGILNLPVSTDAKEREIKVQYRRLARIYHPEKYDPTTNKMSKSEAQEHFKPINNAYKYLRT